MLRMRHIDGIMQPMFMCDVCGDPIEGEGEAFSDIATPGATVPVYHVHGLTSDQDCEKRFLERHPVAYRDMAPAYALDYHAIHITRSLGLTSLDELARVYLDLKSLEDQDRLGAAAEDDDADVDEEEA